MINRNNPEVPLVAIDLDDHAFPFTDDFLWWHDEMFGSEFRNADRSAFSFSEAFGLGDDHWHQMMDAYFVEHARFADPFDGALEAFERMQEHVELFVLTARPLVTREASLLQVREHFSGLFADVHFVEQHDVEGERFSKGQICRKLGAVALLDDADHNVNSADDNGVLGVLVGDVSGNRGDLRQGVIVVDSLAEAADVVIDKFGR